MEREKIFAKVESLHSAPIAFQALWDGGSSGWFIDLVAIMQDGQAHPLGVISDGGDIRLFNGQVPPWPEAFAARQLGSELAERFGAEFYFPSPDHPEDDCPDWRERNKGYPCRRCGILLLQRHACPWRGVCYHCHLDEEREQREAKWTPEQRAGRRCHICGSPATTELNGGPACSDCFDKYVVYRCEKCDIPCMVLKSQSHASLCHRCDVKQAVEALTPSQRDMIRDAKAQSQMEGILTVIDIMGCSLNVAEYVLHMLGQTDVSADSA